jgi:hypothetical protein
MESINEFVPHVHFELIPIKNLVSNQEYQRNLSMRHIQRTVANFNIYQINPVKVSRRNGLNYVINGQHTIEIIAAASGSRETPVWCMVFEDLEYVAEADIFANQQKYVKSLAPYEIFMANIEAGSDAQLTIKSLVESYGLKLAPNRALCGICAVLCLEQIYKMYGYHTLDRTLRLIVATWEGDPVSLSASMLRGVSFFLDAYGDAVKDDAFRERLGAFSATEIIRTGKARRPGAIGYAEAIAISYNRNKKSNLSLRKLDAVKPMHSEGMAEQGMAEQAGASPSEKDSSVEGQSEVASGQ